MPRNLRYRVAVFFAGFGALISLALALALYFAAQDVGQRLVDETLTAELDDYIARRERNPNSLPPSTVRLHGYVQDASNREALPAYLRTLLHELCHHLDYELYRRLGQRSDGLPASLPAEW